MQAQVVLTGADMAIEQKADELYGFIWAYLKENARPPTQREMCKAVRVSPNTLHRLLRLLVAQGRAIHRAGQSRGVWPRQVRL